LPRAEAGSFGQSPLEKGVFGRRNSVIDIGLAAMRDFRPSFAGEGII
jgi:hypothetical protein